MLRDHEQVLKVLDPHFKMSFLRSSIVPNNQIVCNINSVGVGLCNYKCAALWWDLTLKYKSLHVPGHMVVSFPANVPVSTNKTF